MTMGDEFRPRTRNIHIGTGMDKNLLPSFRLLIAGVSKGYRQQAMAFYKDLICDSKRQIHFLSPDMCGNGLFWGTSRCDHFGSV